MELTIDQVRAVTTGGAKVTYEAGKFSVLEESIKEIFENRENITVVPGFDLVPHDENLFGDLCVHPNDEGFAHYFNNLLNFFPKTNTERK